MVVDKLASRLWDELGLLTSVYTDFEKLQSMLSSIKTVLDDAQSRSISDKAVSDWLKKLRDAAFDADDVVDQFHTEALRRRMEKHDQLTGKVRDFFSSNNPIAFRYKMARKIKKIREKFDEIAEERLKFHLDEGSVSKHTPDRETLSSVIESEIYGRDDDKKEVIEFLVDKDNDKNISILAIVGLGGVGKTTLAQLVYNDERINERFELRMWVCVGETFDLKMVMRKMIEQVTEEQINCSSLETMSFLLRRRLKTKRFLLVLDDLWNQEELEWEKLETLFKDSKLGSKIIVTTRNEFVASITGTISPYKLQGLGNDDCWTLFKQRAFRFEREEDIPELVKIGREIIKRCGGLPLAAKALGSLMSSKRGVAAWSAIKDGEIGRVPIYEVEILNILKMSYDDLPSHLKWCFTYCSMFPKDHIFEIKRLIRLWIAEGLIDMSDISLNEEDVGSQNFNNLLWRSFFQDVQMDEYNNPVTCKMHDLVHDLACSLTKDESLVMEMGRKSIPYGCRYLSVVCDDESSTTSKTIYEAKKLRSLVLLGRTYLHGTAHIDKFIFYVTKHFTQFLVTSACSRITMSME
ncbi:putative disease resistance protein RGA1 [Cocos nucifera]|uniref:Putative disease resistance protein RGA1 n=1 Tax=Cocos nucifera TaxID=13894 RepID=A0A8K0I151_COCNU|nr:putative disease resistance protein RGA1 [Cocos nucifera]